MSQENPEPEAIVLARQKNWSKDLTAERRSDRRWRSWARDAGAGKARLTAVCPGLPNWICADDSQSKCGAIQTTVVQSVSGTAVALRLHLGTAALVVQPWKQYEAMARCYGAGP
jgi:hypothetical protein